TCTTKREDLPHLLRLLDDDNEIVRQGVREAFLGYGAELDSALQTLQDRLTLAQKALLDTLLESWVADRLREDWADWLMQPGGTGKLEKGYEILARYRGGVGIRDTLSDDLDRLAEDFCAVCPDGGASNLIRYLFKERGFQGDQENYYAPENSDLIHVLRNRSGLPLTLTSLAILVGSRLGIEIRGCNL
ncbi:MAG: hypothetical protein GWM98_21120, partial [Nitrospinaceae bacterium]|nr:hypothetical protein [Nitrospinaceae bacterium]